MTYKVQTTRKTKSEIKKAQEWYERQSIGLGDQFTDEIKSKIDSLLSPLLEHKAVLKNIRRVLLYRFPYAVYYTRDEQKLIIKIIAVLHNKQSRDILGSRV
jgi:plasmid stabilization system protein ParE